MKIILNVIFLFFSSLFIFAQDVNINQLNKSNEKTGFWVGYHEKTNSKRYSGEFKDGKPIGVFNYYAKEGHLSGTVNFINDSVSCTEMYFDNGKLMAKGNFLSKMKQGKWFTYSRYGNLLNIFNFDKGAMEGIQYLYYPPSEESNTVNIMEEYNCKKGLKNGIWKQYYKLGSVKSEGNYVMAKKEGVFVYYFENGTIDSRGVFKNDLMDGIWLNYDGENSNMKKIVYKNGELITDEKAK